MEFMLGAALLAAVIALAAAGVARPRGGVARLLGRAFGVTQVVLVAFSGLDWAYQFPNRSPWHLAATGHPLALVPALFAGISLASFLRWGDERPMRVIAWSLAEAIAYVAVLVRLELRTDLSFLTFAALGSCALAAAAPFLLAPAFVRAIPPEGSRFHRIAYLRREKLRLALPALASRRGWQFEPAASWLEAGSLHGTLEDGRRVRVTTDMRIWPPAYSVRVDVGGETTLARYSLDGFADIDEAALERAVRG